MPTVESQGLRIFYRDEGEGPAILLIHGHTLDSRVFDEIVPELVSQGKRVIRPDLRGHGQSEMPPQGYHWSHHAADMRAVLDSAGVDTVLLAGFSLGGGVAMEMAITMPENITGLALLSPVMPDRPFEEAFMNNLKDVARSARKEGIRKAMEGPWLMSPLFEKSFTKPHVLEKARLMILDFPGADYLATARDEVSRSWKIPERLEEIRVPTVVLVGSDEMKGFREFAAEAAERIPGARFKSVLSAGHLWPMEQPSLLCDTLLDLMESMDSQGRKNS